MVTPPLVSLSAMPATSSTRARDSMRQRHDEDEEQHQADQGRGKAVAAAEQMAKPDETGIDRHGDDHAPDDRHQKRLGDREAPDGQPQEEPTRTTTSAESPRDGELVRSCSPSAASLSPPPVGERRRHPNAAAVKPAAVRPSIGGGRDRLRRRR